MKGLEDYVQLSSKATFIVWLYDARWRYLPNLAFPKASLNTAGW